MLNIKQFLKQHKKGVTFCTLLLISVIMLLSNKTNVLNIPKYVGISVFSHIEAAVSNSGSFFTSTVGSISELKNLQKEHTAALEKLQYYSTLERNFLELKQENKALKDLLKFSEEISFKNLPAKVIAKDPSVSFTSITINKGTSDGVITDSPVIAFSGGYYGLVGKVMSVGRNSSIIQPVTNSTSYIAARLQKNRFEGLVHGLSSNDDILQMDYVSKLGKTQIQYGDLVITSGMSSLFPKGIYIGRVRSIDDLEYESSLKLSIEPIVSFGSLEYVFVLIEKGTE
ncbi:rod shape-determining protein MreC [Spirochaeta cellobiosiphila]|uniref:rod shape-determining protein MreC n=1 Tax=Spirochaeta cellobiosiphila TaxID=504483 RepID=UPI000421A33C|nr:rod shape-determining protein MreC [Spirochaeta cellobiosiphila]